MVHIGPKSASSDLGLATNQQGLAKAYPFKLIYNLPISPRSAHP